MNRVLLTAVAAMLGATLLAACGGGSTKPVKTDNGNVSVNTSKKLPDNFPSDFPVYSGADVQGSVTGTQNGITGTVVTWQTDDSFDKVKSYYDDALKSGAWKSTTTGTAGDSAYWLAENSAGTKYGYLTVAKSGDATGIVATVGDKDDASSGGSTSVADEDPTSPASSGASTPSASDLPAEAKLPSDYPSDRVPIPSGARVTQATSTNAAGKKTYVIELYVKGSPESVANNFKSELPKHDWTEVVSSQTGGEYFLTFSGANDDGVTVTVLQSDVQGYAQVSLLVIVSG